MALYSTAVRTSRLEVLTTNIPNNASVRVYDGTPPASTAAALSGNTLLWDGLVSGAFGTVTAGVLTANTISGPNASASGTPTFVRVVNPSAPTTVYAQFTAGVGSGEWSFDSAIVSGQPVTVSGLTIEDEP